MRSFFNIKKLVYGLKRVGKNMTRKKFEKKYKTEIALMAKAQDVDMVVATDMLIEHVKNRNVDTPHKYDFPGQENLNYTELDKEIAEIEATEAVLRQA